MDILRLEEGSLSAFRRQEEERREILLAGEVTNVSELTCQDVYAQVILRDETGRIVGKENNWVATLGPGASEAFQVTLTLPEALKAWPAQAQVEFEFSIRGKTPRAAVPVEG